jgi:hypothetical protein
MSPEEQFSRHLCRVLEQGTRDFDTTVSERLRAARERALARHSIALEPVTILGAGSTALRLGSGDEKHPFRMFFAILALLLGVCTAYYWNGFDQASENEEIDSALLADDLPPNAYLDQGFQAWLEKRSSESSEEQ